MWNRLAEIEKRLPPPEARPSTVAARRRTAARARLEEETQPLAPAIRAAGPSASDPTLPPIQEAQEEWVTVSRKKAKKARQKERRQAAAAAATTSAAPTIQGQQTRRPTTSSTPKAPMPSQAAPNQARKKKPTKKKKVRLTPPRTTAVVLNLHPEAKERGVTYAQALLRARESFHLDELGIPHVKIKTSATGAKILEIPGAASGSKADCLAERLKSVLADCVSVSRPQKCATLRISGLDVSARKEDIAAALTTASGSPPGQIKIGDIRRGPRGLGSVLVKCPIFTAKKLMSIGRVKVGWSSVQIAALSSLPMRCFRCLGVGHTRMRCPSNVDRTGLCFKCGLSGHKAAQCSATAYKCAICASEKRPHAHMMGSVKCRPSPTRARSLGEDNLRRPVQAQEDAEAAGESEGRQSPRDATPFMERPLRRGIPSPGTQEEFPEVEVV